MFLFPELASESATQGELMRWEEGVVWGAAGAEQELGHFCSLVIKHQW